MNCSHHRIISLSEQFQICSLKNYSKAIQFYKMNSKRKKKKKNIKTIIKLKEN